MRTNYQTFKEYLDSWPEGQWFDDSDETYDGLPPDEAPEHPAPDAVVEFTSGVVFDKNDKELGGLVSHFRKWERSRTRTNVVCDVPKERLDDLADFLKGIGGKVVK